MKMMIRTAALVVAVGLIWTAGLPAQVTPEPVVESPSSVNARVPVTVPTPPLRDLQALIGRSLRGSSGNGAGSVLIVPAAEMSLEDLAAATEDMTVMARILRSALGQADATGGGGAYGVSYDAYGDIYDGGRLFFDAGPALLMGRSARTGQSIYLQGYGALFTMKVGVPLSPGPEGEEPPKKAEPNEVDPVWVQAHQEIYAPEQAERGKTDEEGPEYSAEKVDSLKTALITALKHAANIRNMVPDEVVVLTVTGRPVADQIESVRAVPGTNQIIVQSGGATRVYEGRLPDDIQTMSAPTVLTIRAKRSDIDAFAKDELNLNQFRQRVQILSHPDLGAEGASTVSTAISTGYRHR